MTNTLPKGLTAADFASAITELTAIVGAQNALIDQDQLASYRKPYVPVKDDEFVLSGALMPVSVEQIQRILTVCNKYRIPVWPISTGRNIGLGSALPASSGQLILDLGKMNRILEVDEELGTALIEPGVTYRQLQEYIDAKKLPFLVDAPSPGPIVSPLSNTLERGNGYTTNHDHMKSFAGMEIVLANGDVIKTGMGELPNCKSWQAYRYGYGPYIDGLFTQSNFAIVTKMGIFLTPKPEGAKAFAVHYNNPEDIVKAIDVFRKLRMAEVITVPGSALSGLTMLAFGRKRTDLYKGSGSIPDEAINGLLKQHGIPQWRIGGVVYGDEQETAIKLKKIEEAFKATNPSKMFVDGNGDGPGSAADVAVATGHISLENFRILNYVGGGGVIWHMPVSAMKGRYVDQLAKLSKEILNRHGFDYLSMNWLDGRDMHKTTGIFFNHSDPAQVEAARACYDELVQLTSKEGFGNYRASVHYMDKQADLFGQNTRNLHRNIKKALDPNGIIAPGKSGITI
ncbi:FAD-binding oxidoreductase [Pseudomonas sp. TWI672]|uniref:FAD-binding oxidoreductase n=1 Tax=unclassified Pseudomonas TaxID=196821 RepID=UPI00320856CC